jgi:hypothetical protein
MDAGELDEILKRGETRNIEIKGVCAFANDMRAHLATSIVAMANSPSGGTLIIGVENGTWQVQGLIDEQLKTFDKTAISQYLGKYVTPLPHVEVERVDHPQGRVLLLQISEFEDVPIVVSKRIADSVNKTHASEGDLWIRTESCECRRIASADEMRELLSRAMTKRSENLLAQIRSVIIGAPPTQPMELPEDLFAQALPDWSTIRNAWETQHPEYAWWEVNLLPISNLVKQFQLDEIVTAIDKSEVRWRGWYYPTHGVRGEKLEYMLEYVHFSYEADRNSERWQAGRTGAFGSAHIDLGDFVEPDLGSDLQPPPMRFIDFTGIVFSMTEFFRFATNMAGALGCEELWLRVTLHNVLGRPLGAFDRRYSPWSAGNASMRDIAQARIFSHTELESAWRDLALDWAKQILTVFQWPEANREMLARHQMRLIERRW